MLASTRITGRRVIFTSISRVSTTYIHRLEHCRIPSSTRDIVFQRHNPSKSGKYHKVPQDAADDGIDTGVSLLSKSIKRTRVRLTRCVERTLILHLKRARLVKLWCSLRALGHKIPQIENLGVAGVSIRVIRWSNTRADDD